MSKFELLGYHHEVAEHSLGLDFLRTILLVASVGAFVTSEWLLGLTALFLALVSGHGIPREVANFHPGGAR